MSILRGEVVVECDVKTCQACETLVERDLNETTLRDALTARGWGKLPDGRDVCPQCIDECILEGRIL